MIWLLPLVLLIAAGIFIAYSLFSAAAKARKRASKAVTALRAVDSELRSQYQEIQNSVSQAANSYIQEVRAGRLRSMPLDELKRHESGLRLQALKDAGIRRGARSRERNRREMGFESGLRRTAYSGLKS